MTRALFGLAILGLFVRCGGSPAVTCQTQDCSNDAAKSFQVCSLINGNVSYSFGGQSCSCTSSDITQCQTCTAQVANYCQPGGGGGAGGTGGGGTGGGGTGTIACTAVFSGAFSGTYTPCAMTVAYTPAATEWTVATAGGAVPGTPYTWTGLTFALSGQPSTGTFEQSQALGATTEVTDQSNSDPPVWLAGSGNGMIFGTGSLTITSLGPSISTGAGMLYQSPHGSWTGTLVDQNAMTSQPDVMQTITF